METGEAIQTFIQRLRIDRAKLLLETSSLPIEHRQRYGLRSIASQTNLHKAFSALAPVSNLVLKSSSGELEIHEIAK